MNPPREQLLDAFRADLREYLDGMRSTLTKLDRTREAVTPAELDEVHRLAHSLRAAARACDFGTLEQIGRRLEQFFGEIRKGTLLPERAAIATIREVLDAIEDWSLKLAEATPGEPAHALGLLDRLLGQTPDRSSGEKASVPPRPKDTDDLTRKLQAAFQAEHKEHLEGIRVILAGIKGDSLAAGQIDEVFRRAHSLKGAARIAEVGPVESVAHHLETLFSRVREGELRLSPEIVRAVHTGLDAIEDAAAAVANNRPPAAPARALEMIESVLGTRNLERGKPSNPKAETEQTRATATEAPRSERRAPNAVPAETLRVSADHLDRLLRSAGEFQTEALHLGLVERELAEVGRQIDGMKRESDAVRSTAAAELRRLAETPGFAHVHRYLIAIERQVRVLAKAARGVRRRHQRGAWALQQLGGRLQQDVQRVRMVSADSVFQGFHKMVRDLAHDEGKEIEFRAVGLETLADRVVLQMLKDPIMHLLLNAVTHGVERPDKRRAQGKPEDGRVALQLETLGSRLRVSVEDDGKGIDLRVVAETAVRRGLLTETEVVALPGAELAQLVFRPGFTTSQTVTGVSGRGMGLSVVHEAAARLQGELELFPVEGGGTRVVISVPLCISTQRLLLVGCRGQTYGIPLRAIERLVRSKPQEIETVEGKPMLVLDGHAVSVAGLVGLLDGVGDEPLGEGTILFAVIRSGTQRLAVVVDSLLAERDGLVRPLDGPAARVPTLAGGFLLEDGAVALVLNPAALFANAGGRTHASPQRAAPVAEKKAPTVLVVDDSLTTRTLERSILEVHGYTVRIAVDGLEGLAKLRAEPVDLVITDIEMPHMDGFRLIEEMKKDPRLARIPVIVVTSLAKREDQERGLALGADAYIVKRKFDHQDLLDTIRQIL